RWSSTFTMLEQYVRIRDEIKRVDAVYDLVPKPAAHRRIVALTETLKTINSVCKKLQEDTLSIGAVRVRFDKMAEMFPITSSLLSPDANIIHSSVFESAVVKVIMAIPPTSNRCERLVSQCKLVMTLQRSSLLPINFEMIEFLRTNRKYWDAHTLMGIDVADADD
ncbi:hypothetical protein PHYSODRAFT_490553, partial [Phytophthora sojae]